MLAEVMVALAIFGITASVSLVALTHMNNRAFLSRCQTGASTVAQNQIDLILSDMPFNPQKNQVPPALTIGTTDVGSAAAPTVSVYKDPQTDVVSVLGWMRTIVENVGAIQNGQNMNIYRATVTVSYRYRTRNYSVVMSTMRAPDL